MTGAEAPLLEEGPEEAHIEVVSADCLNDEDTERSGCGNGGAVCNVAVTAVGAGMLALPRAMAEVGVVLGFVLFGVVCLLTYFSSSIIVRFASKRGKRTYSELVKSEFGTTGAIILQLSIILHVAGVMIVYLIIIADMIVGSAPKWDGMLPSMLGIHDGVWYLSRPLVTAVLALAAIVPMLISRDLSVVARYSRNSIIMMLFLSSTMILLAVVAVVERKQAPSISFLPPLHGEGILSASWKLLVSSLSVLAVGFLAFTCQFNLLPVHHSMRDTRCSNMLNVTKAAIALCAVLYGSVALSGYVLFGDETEGDVLKNLTISAISGLTGRTIATALIDFVVIANSFNLMVNFVLKVWAVRESLSELIWDRQALDLSRTHFYILTYVLTVLAYLTSVFVPSVWVLMSLIGSTACVTFSYIFPGLISGRNGEGLFARAGGYAVVGMAGIIAIITIVNTLSGHVEL